MRGRIMTSAIAVGTLASACAPVEEAATMPDPVDLTFARAVADTELAFAQMARDAGTWTAFRHYATADAVMPAPDMQNVQERLKDRPDPPEAIVWEPDLVWTSCDGEYALSTGPADYPGGERGRFATIWQRQPDGSYRWVIDQGFELPADYAQPDAVSLNAATCPAEAFIRETPGKPDDRSWGRSSDQSLYWETALTRDCARTFSVHAHVDGAMREVFRREAAAPAVPAGRDPIACAD